LALRKQNEREGGGGLGGEVPKRKPTAKKTQNHADKKRVARFSRKEKS